MGMNKGRCSFWIWFCFITLLAGASLGMAQKKLSKKGGFLFPIKPGYPASLTGNMGEIRSNHFHGGLDVRTGWASGLPVIAIKDGYLSRVSMAGEGYGNTMFITHPDGFVSVYAHLEKLSQPFHDVVKRQQYEQKIFEVDVLFHKDIFKIKQGDTIGISGNTGSSRGPHLHFEIRDTAGMVYNPLSFGFDEVQDNLSPVVDRLAIVPLETDARINGKFERKEVLVKEAGKEFVATEIPQIQGTIGLEIKARDRINNGTSNGGIFCIEMFLDGNMIYYHNLNQFPISKTNHVNQLINYRNFRLTAEKFQKLYCPDGYFQTRNTPEKQRGRIHIPEGMTGNLEIVLWDVHGNKRIAKMRLNSIPKELSVPSSAPLALATRIQHDILDNTLIIKTNGETGLNAQLDLFFKNQPIRISPEYKDGKSLVFLHDLRKGLPDSAKGATDLKEKFSFVATLIPNQPYNLSLPGIGLTMKESVLFDTLYLESFSEEGGIQTMSNSLTPLADVMTVSLSCGSCLKDENGKYRSYAEAANGLYNKSLYSECRESNLFFNTKYLGKFRILKDSTAPIIRMGVCNGSWAKFNIYDNLSGIDKVEGTINGEWILMVADKKKHEVYAEPWPKQLPMRGEFKLKVTDKAGNVTVFIRKV